MRAELIEFNEDGKILLKRKLNCHICFNENNTAILEISLPDRTQTIHQSISVPIRRLLYLVEKYDERKPK